MNRIYRSIWNERTGTFSAASENTKAHGKTCTSGSACVNGPLSRSILAASILLATSAAAFAAPTGANVVAGTAGITVSPGLTVINQTSDRAAINWQSFDIARGEAVRINQPASTSVLLNRVIGANPSSIFGTLSANGQVFLVNPNGILFGSGASVNVGGLVASSLGITDADFVAGRSSFTGTNSAAVVNNAAIHADGGYVALLGGTVSNNGTISAKLGTVALAAGDAVALDIAGDNLLSVNIGRAAFNAAVQNGGVISADGGQVVLTTQAAGSLLSSVVNNTGVIEARTVSSREGTIRLLAGMGDGTVAVGGTLDASAPTSGNGGFIDTSAAHVKVLDTARVSTLAAHGKNGSWLIDPQDFTIGSGPNDNISGPKLSALLVTNSVVISTNTGPDVNTAGAPPVSSLNTAMAGNGDIVVNQAVSWTASSNPTTLSLLASRDVTFNAAVSATNGNLVVCCGRDINVNAALTTTNGSMLLSAGRSVNISGALTTTDGNIEVCAANDILIGSKITLTRGSTIPQQSLGLPAGLVLNSGFGGTGPGEAGGTVRFAPLAPPATVTGPQADVVINYNPPSYLTPTDYRPNFVLSGGATLTQHMLVFASVADKTYDGTTSASLTGLNNAPAGVSLIAGPGSTAAFDSADAGLGKVVTFSGYSLGGPNASMYALPTSCCGAVVFRTSGKIAFAPGVVTGTTVGAPVVNAPSTQPGLITPTPLSTSSVVAPVDAIMRTVVPQTLTWPSGPASAGTPMPILTLSTPPVPVLVAQPAPEAESPPVVTQPPVTQPPVKAKRPARVRKQDRN